MQPFLIDTHCHLDLPAFDVDRAEVIARARAAGVRALMVIGFAPERWSSALELASSSPGLFATIGVHPTEAARYDDTLERAMVDLARHPLVCAIGEIGLDYYWDRAPRSLQRGVFVRQIHLAKALDLPFVVHQRDAADDTLEVLREAGPPHRGVMHCFTGDLDYARSCLDLGMYLGVGGIVTYPKAGALREALRSAPLDRVVLETDAPYLSPAPYRGKRNEPANVAIVARALAEIRGVSQEEIARITSENAMRLLRLRADHLNCPQHQRPAHAVEVSER
jgi:TatD DNase family protein